MATVSAKLDLTGGVWQSIGAIGFVGQLGYPGTIEIVNADSLPSGAVAECMTMPAGAALQFAAPASGTMYARAAAGTNTLMYYEV